jgi:hypothetical protein
MAIQISLLLYALVMLAPSISFGGNLFHRQDSLVVDSENVLSGIDLYNNKIDQVIHTLGEPTRVTVSHRTEVSETRVYEWETKACSLRLTASALTDGRLWIESVDVLGAHPDGTVGTTGRGLKLGDSIRDVRRIYGLRLYFGTTVSENKRPQFARTGPGCRPSLEIDFDEARVVKNLRLTLACGPSY